MDGEPSKKKKRENKPTCRLCKNHNLKILSSGHKEHCPGQHCICEKCNDQKEEREKTANETKKSRAEKQEIERQERIKLNGSELVKFEAEKDIIPFIIPEKYKDRLQNSIDKEVFKYIDFKKEMLISFEVQKGKKRKANIKEEESNEKITTLLNEDLLQHTLLCLCSCLGYDIRYTTILSWTIKKIVAIFCEYPGEEEKNSEDVKRRISLASIIRHMKIIRRTITWNVIPLFIIVLLIYYLLPFIYCLFPS